MTNSEDAMIYSSSRLEAARRVIKYATDRTRPELLANARAIVAAAEAR